MSSEVTRAGFISLIGRPNVGKSAFLNRVVTARLMAVSNRPQTTRDRVTGILNRRGVQFCFVDLPGLQEGDDRYNRRLRSLGEKAVAGADVVLYMIDGLRRQGTQSDLLFERWLSLLRIPIIGVVTKIDRWERDRLQEFQGVTAYWSARCRWESLIAISAVTGCNIPKLLDLIEGLLPITPHFFPNDCLSDRNDRFWVAELIRESAMMLTGEEVPHALTVMVGRYEDEERLLRVSADLVVEREGQKGIVVGSSGSMIKRIGVRSRKAIEEQIGKKLFLELRVVVKKNWRNDERFLDQLEAFYKS